MTAYRPDRLPSRLRRALPWVGLPLLLAALGWMVWPARPPAPDPRGPEAAFMGMMAAHHAQAVEMARLVRPRVPSREVRSLALDIELGQQEEERQMTAWLARWHVPPPNVTSAHARAMGLASPAELAALSDLPPAQAQAEFLRLMLRHHRGALAMLPPMLGPGVRPEVRLLALKMEREQTSEVGLMEHLQTRWTPPTGDTPPPDMDGMPGMGH